MGDEEGEGSGERVNVQESMRRALIAAGRARARRAQPNVAAVLGNAHVRDAMQDALESAGNPADEPLLASRRECEKCVKLRSGLAICILCTSAWTTGTPGLAPQKKRFAKQCKYVWFDRNPHVTMRDLFRVFKSLQKRSREEYGIVRDDQEVQADEDESSGYQSESIGSEDSEDLEEGLAEGHENYPRHLRDVPYTWFRHHIKCCMSMFLLEKMDRRKDLRSLFKRAVPRATMRDLRTLAPLLVQLEHLEKDLTAMREEYAGLERAADDEKKVEDVGHGRVEPVQEDEYEGGGTI